MTPILITVEPFDPVTGERTLVRVASALEASAYGVGGQRWYPAITQRPIITIELMSLDMSGRVQSGQCRFSIKLDVIHKEAARWKWSGAPVKVYAARDLVLRDPEFEGVVTSPTLDVDTNQLALDCSTDAGFLKGPLLLREFDGSGGIDGEPDKRGTLLPAGFGSCENIPPVWFDTTRWIGMLDGYGNTLGITRLMEGLSDFGPAVGDYPSYAALADAIDEGEVAPGRWATCEAEGLVGLGAPPVGVIGVNAVFGAGTLGQMIERVLLNHRLVPPARVDSAAMDALDDEVPFTAHFWTAEQRDCGEFIEALAASGNATPVVLPQGIVTVTRAAVTTPSATLDRTGSQLPRVTDWKSAAPVIPMWRLAARTARPAGTIDYKDVNYVDDLIDRGAWKVDSTYRAGHIVWLPNKSSWLYVGDEPSAGHAPPEWPTTENAWWQNLTPPITSGDITYADGTPIEDLKPAAPGATRNQNRGAYSDSATYEPGDFVVWRVSDGGNGNGYTRIGTGLTTGVQPTDGSKWSLTVERGDAGAPGETGGGSALVGQLTKESARVFAFATGVVSDYGPASATFVVRDGADDVSSDFTLSVVANPQALVVSVNQSTKTFTITGGLDPEEKAATITLRMSGGVGSVYEGYSVDKIFSVEKIETGYELVSALPTTNLFDGRIVYLESDDKLYIRTGGQWRTLLNNVSVISPSQIADGSISGTKFASGIEPVGISTAGSLPTTKTTEVIMWQGKLYRWGGAFYTAAVPAADVTGQLTNAQIQSLAASKLTGAIDPARIADGSIAGTKFASGIEPVTVASGASLPTVKSTEVITWNGKLYRWNGAAYTAAVAAVDISGQLTNAQVVSIASNKITGQLTDAQIAALSAAKVTGQITGTQISNDAITTPKIAAGAVEAGQIAAGAVTSEKLTITALTDNLIANPRAYDGTVNWYTSSGGTIVASYVGGTGAKPYFVLNKGGSTTAIAVSRKFLVEPGKTYAVRVRAWGSVPTDNGFYLRLWTAAVEPGANYVTTGSNWVTTGIENASFLSTADDRAIWEATVTVPAGMYWASLALYNWTAGPAAMGFTDVEVREQVQGVRIENGAVDADKIAANAVTADKISANAVTADKIAANSITAAKIVAGTITATELAADSVTADKIAANSITGDKIQANTISGNKLILTPSGQTINADPGIADPSIWTVTSPLIAVSAVTGSQWIGARAWRVSQIVSSNRIISDKVPIDRNKVYRASFVALSSGTAMNAYGCVFFFDNTGTLIADTSSQPGIGTWPAAGSYAYFGLVSQPPPGTSTQYDITFGAGQAAGIPTAARFMAIGSMPAHNGTSGGNNFFGSFMLQEVMPAELIVNGAITADKIAANAVTTDKLAANSITAAKIAANTITAGQIAAGAITASELAANAVTAVKIAAGQVTADKIASNAITAVKIDAGAVTTDKLAAGSVTAAKIGAGQVTTDKLAANSVTAAKIQVDSLDAISANLGSITVGSANIAELSIGTQKIVPGAVSLSQVVTTGNKNVGAGATVTLFETGWISIGDAYFGQALISLSFSVSCTIFFDGSALMSLEVDTGSGYVVKASQISGISSNNGDSYYIISGQLIAIAEGDEIRIRATAQSGAYIPSSVSRTLTIRDIIMTVAGAKR